MNLDLLLLSAAVGPLEHLDIVVDGDRNVTTPTITIKWSISLSLSLSSYVYIYIYTYNLAIFHDAARPLEHLDIVVDGDLDPDLAAPRFYMLCACIYIYMYIYMYIYIYMHTYIYIYM